MKNLLLGLILASTVIPFERDVTRLPQPKFLTSHYSSSGNYFEDYAGDANEELFYQGFSFMNMGPNDIVPTTPEGLDYPYRNFSFVTEDHARRDVYLWLTDYNGSGRISDMYETVMVFLPRNNQMSIEEKDNDMIVTLTTGEEVIFSAQDKTIQGGVLSEDPLDLNPDRNQRHFSRVHYNGKGIVIRSDIRANDPRQVKKSRVMRVGKDTCVVDTKVFWTQEDFPQFKFVDDESAYSAIEKNCGKDFLD
jgi:hypothetical protein